MLKFKVIWIDQESEGELCTGCKEKIEGIKWVMMLDFDDPVNFPTIFPIRVMDGFITLYVSTSGLL